MFVKMKHSLIVCLCVFSLVHSNEEEWEYFVPRLRTAFKNVRNDGENMIEMIQIPQKLDNFNSSNNLTWKMRVQSNGQFFKPNGPIFIMIGGENPFSNNWLEQGQMYDMAKENNAYMFYTEHRFYGGSRPTNTLILDNLKYLTPDQALADVVNLVRRYKCTSSFARSKVVVFGGSYAGNLALWIRAKYPDDIHAAVSSSAPLLAKFDFQEYHEEVQNTLGLDCSAVISRAMEQILSVLGTPEGAKKVQKDFNMCNPLDSSDLLEISYLLSIITTYFGGVVQNYPAAIKKMTCNEILFPTSEDEYTRLTNFLNDALGPRCRKGYGDFKNYIRTTNGGNLRQWMYQSCTQFGFFQTTSSRNQPFGNALPVEMYQTWCKDFFGTDFDPIKSQSGITRTNLIYGGLNPKVTRVVSIHGTADPWHKLGLSKDLNPDAPVIIVNGTYHCEDLNSISLLDTEEMKNAKLLVQNYVKKWLNED